MAGGIVACGVVIGTDDGAEFGLRYRLFLDQDWRVREATLESAAGKRLHLASDGEGHWTQDGLPAPSLDGCIDIDIEATPFTNTLPIRRLPFGPSESHAIQLVYIRVPSLEAAIGNQRYTAIEPGRRFRFESLDHDFAAELPVDRHGLVQDYPGLFRRIR